MKDQLEMNFGEAETVDPVSGNDVPPGSLPEEVRDDIPARLSEGEYVVPADVVRYYGVKFFEDLRTQAKMGLQQMDEDGRIGGEPIETSESEVDIDDLIDAEINNMNEGGVVSGYRTGGYGTRGSYGYGYRPTVKEIVPEIQTVPDMPEVVKPVETKAVSGFTGVKIYYNAQGLQVPIQFQNGQPVGGQQALKGLFEKNPMDEGPSETIFGVNPVTGTPYKNQRESEEAELEGRAEVISKYNFNDPDKLLDKIEELKKGSTENSKFLSSPLSFLIPGTGLIKTFTAVTNQSNNNAQIRATAQIAKERGYDFLLTIEIFKQLTQSNCHYCGIEPSQKISRSWLNGDYMFNGVDRVNNSIGYLENNVVPCCKHCNMAKYTMSEEEFRTWINRLIAFNSKKVC